MEQLDVFSAFLKNGLTYSAPISAQLVFSIFLTIVTNMYLKQLTQLIDRYEQNHIRELYTRTEFFNQQLTYYKELFEKLK